MKIYISGKIGEDVISDATREKFARVEKVLKSNGIEVFNPCNEEWQHEVKEEYNAQTCEPGGKHDEFVPFYTFVLLCDLAILSGIGGIYLLSDWEHSPGAKSEMAFACATGKLIFFESREHAVQYLESRWENGMNKTTISTKSEYVEDHIDEYWMPIV